MKLPEATERIAAYGREERERAARLAESPYGDEVQAYGSEEPKAVGLKIAKAIRALAQREALR